MGWVKVFFPFKTNDEAQNSLSYQKKYFQRVVLNIVGFFPPDFLKKLQTNFGIEINLLPPQKFFMQTKPTILTPLKAAVPQEERSSAFRGS